LAPVPFRGKRCEPAYVAEIAAAIAEARGLSLEALSAETCTTARRFFPKMG
jgi:TatD DNase family protein